MFYFCHSKEMNCIKDAILYTRFYFLYRKDNAGYMYPLEDEVKILLDLEPPPPPPPPPPPLPPFIILIKDPTALPNPRPPPLPSLKRAARKTMKKNVRHLILRAVRAATKNHHSGLASTFYKPVSTRFANICHFFTKHPQALVVVIKQISAFYFPTVERQITLYSPCWSVRRSVGVTINFLAPLYRLEYRKTKIRIQVRGRAHIT